MKRKGLLLLFIGLLLSCSSEPPKLTPLPKNGVILALGDSLTEGVGAERSDAYPAILETLLKRRVVNAGVSGDTTKEGLNRLPALLIKYHPSLVIVSLGGNDLLRRVPDKEITKHLEKIITDCKTNKAQVVVLAPPKPNLSLSSPELYDKLAKKYHIVVNTSLLPGLLSTREFKSDHIHLNKAGYQRLAEGVAKILKENGAVSED